ncbi:MAG: sigma-70 family RNA polymerase sigma factor [Thermodesulfobacteriota bacterium]
MKYDELNVQDIETESYPEHFEETAEDDFTEEDVFGAEETAGDYNGAPAELPDRVEMYDRQDDQFRILNDYFRDISKEPLLTIKEEVEIPAKIKKCEHKIKQITSYLESSYEDIGNGRKSNGQNNHKRNRNRLNASLKAYSHQAEKLKKRFASANLRLVISIAKRYVNHGLPFLDLIQEGNIGLMKAIERYDHSKGFRFSTYASWWIYQAITRAILVHRGAVRVPVYLLEVTSRVYRTKSILMKESGKNPTAEEISERSGVPLKYVSRILKITNESVSLDSPVDGEKRTLYDFIEDEETVSPDHLVVDYELKESIRSSLSLLSVKEEEVLRMRFGIDRSDVVTLDDIGRKFKLTRERIRQIEKKALRKLSVSRMKEALKNFRT